MGAGRREVGDTPRRPGRAQQRGLPRVGRFRVPSADRERVTERERHGRDGDRESLVQPLGGRDHGGLHGKRLEQRLVVADVALRGDGERHHVDLADRRVAVELREPEIRAAGDRGHDSGGLLLPRVPRPRAPAQIPRPRRRGRGPGRSGRPSARRRGRRPRGRPSPRRLSGQAPARHLPPLPGSRAPAIRRHRVASRGRCRCDGGAARGSRSRSRPPATPAAPGRQLRSPEPRHPAPATARSPSARPRAVELTARPRASPLCLPERHLSVTRWSSVCPATASWTSPRLSGVEYVLNDASVQLR